jgi:hypothetical protein
MSKKSCFVFFFIYNMDNLDININYKSNNNIDIIQHNKMLFLFNAIEEGWCVKKKENSYVFSKNHEGKKEVFNEDYLTNFIKKNFKKRFSD